MIQRVKNFKKKVIRKISQIYADFLFGRLQMLIDIEDDSSFERLYDIASSLNAYCIVFHNIYLD